MPAAATAAMIANDNATAATAMIANDDATWMATATTAVPATSMTTAATRVCRSHRQNDYDAQSQKTHGSNLIAFWMCARHNEHHEMST